MKALYAGIAFFLAGYFVTVSCATAQGRTTDSLPATKTDTAHPKIIGLKAVEITVAKPPFTLRNDTLEFDASAIRLAANASVLQLLKKLPGVVIGSDGSITVNGKPVTKIKVDGREFFGDNKEAATKYLPADIIDKIEVTDTKDVAAQRSLAVKAPAEDVTVNLVLKKDKNTGIMGNITAGAGSHRRYLADGMISSMRNPTRISVMAAAKNVTDETGGAIMMSPSGMVGGGGGLPEYNNGSININTKPGKKLTLDVNYNYNNTKNNQTTITDRLNLLPDNSFHNQTNSDAVAGNSQHQLYTNLVYEKDSLTTWTFRSNAGIGKSSNNLQMYSLSETSGGTLLNTLSSRSNGEAHTGNGGSEINFNKTSRNRRLNLNTTWKFDAGSKKENEYNNSVNNFYTDNSVSHRDSVNQYISSAETSFNNNFTFNLSASLGHGFVAALDYTLGTMYNRQLREVFKEDPVSGKYGMRDSALSGSSRNTSFTHTPSVQLAWKNDRLSIALNTGMRILQQENRLLWLDSVIKIHQQQFAPNLQLNYSLSKYGRLFTNYSISSSAPSAEQLSPVVDNTNPLFMKVGNPLLKGVFTQNVALMFYIYQPVKGFSFNLGANGTVVRNEIVADQRYDSLGRQISTFQNVNGTWRMMVHGNINLQKKKNSWTFNNGLNVSMNRNRSIGLVAGEENISNGWTAGAGVYFSVIYKEWLTISPAVNVDVNNTVYSLPGIDNVNYTTQRFNLQWQLIPVKRLELSGDMAYNYNSQVTAPDQRRYFICNSAVAYSFGKKEQLKLKCRINDLFNNNTNISNITTATYTETKQVNALQRYVMITFQYFFGKMGPQ
ncbi:outer membrane beta-barrel protein [Chitinophaga sp. ARDCPP14]|uniref:outer membrane beta-barrel protein n=1 Tax=Chitinophaga sp. ARDCPP14 TaxID=3391139 RepID=UPI003F5229AE